MTLIAIDFETHPISEEYPAPKPVCLSYATESERHILLGNEIEPFLKNILSLTDVTIIAHNLKFEALVIHEWYPGLRSLLWEAYEAKKLACTMVNEKIINNFANKQTQHKFDLAFLVQKYLKKDITAGKKNPDAWRLRYHELEGIPLEEWPQEPIDYSIQDSVSALEVHNAQPLKHHELSYRSTRADFVLGLSANFGMKVCPDRIILLKEELLEKLTPKYKYLETNGFGHVCTVTGKFKKNIKELKEYIERNVQSPDRTAKGSIKVTSEALSNYVPDEGAESNFADVVRTFQELSQYEKILTAFVPALEKAARGRGLIRTNYNPVVSTGRTSSSGSKLYPSMNIQQAPKKVEGVTNDVRGCFKARDGYKIVSIDYGGLELCSVAHQLFTLLGHSRMRELLNTGDRPMDLHSNFAAQVMSLKLNKNIMYEEFFERKKEPDFDYYRQICKALTSGFPGGIGFEVMGGQLFKYGIELRKRILKKPDGKPVMAFTNKQANYFVQIGRHKNPNIRAKRIGKKAWIFIEDELVGLKNRYFEMYPEMQEFLTEKHKEFLTGDTKMQKNEYGEWEKEPLYRFESCGLKRDFAMYTQFCNGYLMQSPSAEGAKEMLWQFGHEFRNNPDVNLTAFIHDEIVFEVADNTDFEKNVDRASEIMIRSMHEVISSVRINVEASAMTYWSKSGDKSFDRLYWADPKGELRWK